MPSITSVWLTLLLLLSATVAQAAAPSVGAITPTGFQRGTEVESVFNGARLGDAQQLLFYSPGIKVLELKAENDTTVKAKLSIAPDCRLGIHAVRLRSATGISDLRLFTVGALPEVKEQEPNSDFAAPQAVPLGCTVSGVVENEDVDYFVVEAKKGERLSAELEGLRLAYTFFDPYLAILNAKRFESARSDDAPLLRQDCLCSILVPEDGKYIIQVRESSYGGNGACKYRLHIGKFPRPTGVYPAGGKPGQVLAVRWIGDPAGDFTQQITLPSLKDLSFGLYAQDPNGIAPSPNLLRVIDLENTLEVEPNDTLAQATLAIVPGALNGIIEKPGDVDHFKFTAQQGQVFDMRVVARDTLRSPLDSVLTVFRANGSQVAANDDTGGPDSYLRFTAPDNGEFVVAVTDHLKAGGPSYVYRVEIALVEASLTMVLPERVQYVPVTLAVPRGNRMALMVNASRANWGGDLNVNVEGLPPGVTLQTIPMTADKTSVPVLFTAAPDAPLNGTLADVVGRPVDPNLKFVGHLAQRTMLVRGDNNRDVWGHDADRMAASEIDEVPFQIEIEVPKTPIVRQGSKSLKVVAKRKAGFTQPIALRLLYDPPGIGASGSISIPGDKSEALIPLTANPSAALGAWPMLVIGTANVGNGAIEVATQVATLTIAEAFFNFKFEKAAAELGQTAELVVNVEKKTDFVGEAEVRLLGLPANTSTKPEPLKITKDSTQIVFPIAVEKAAKPATYKGLVCQAIVVQEGEPIVHTLGGGELRVDAPLPPKVAAPAPPQAAPQPPPPPPSAPVVEQKRLSRLEKLRLDKAADKAGK
ncbi:MAG: PPC domain-containing protein [Planctomycetota bacterium]|nr:PPC domain-containing protein [Planctomycetota bacterium]